MEMYDVMIIGAGPGGIFTAYELMEKAPDLKIAVFEMGHELKQRHCPIDGDKVKSCIHCASCSIMSGFGGAGAFSDGKYNITNDFGGTLYEYIGKNAALELMEYVERINLRFGGEGTKLYSTKGTAIRKVCIQNGLHLLDASVRHLGTDVNYVVLEHLYEHLRNHVEFHFDCPVDRVEMTDLREESALFPREEAAVNGWRRYVSLLRLAPSPIVLISVYVWSFLQKCSLTLRMNSMKARLSIARRSTVTWFVPSV